MIDEIRNTALLGIQKGLSGIAEKADKISRAYTPDSDIDVTSEIIGIKSDEFQVRANAVVIKTTDDLEKSILDILA